MDQPTRLELLSMLGAAHIRLEQVEHELASCRKALKQISHETEDVLHARQIAIDALYNEKGDST